MKINYVEWFPMTAANGALLFKMESKKQCICYKYFQYLSSRIIIDVIIDPDFLGAGDF